VRIDVQSGIAEKWQWPANEKGQDSKPGNLLVTSEQVVVVNDMEVAGYSKGETALANRQGRVEASPRDPKGDRALAGRRFRTNHHELAQEKMKQAVDLANAEGGGGTADILTRLYRTNLAFAEQLLDKEEIPLRDMARFYYQQGSAVAREPE